jgi:hypothetical protein
VDILTIDKSKLLKTIGWGTVGLGLYLVGLGVVSENDVLFRSTDDFDPNIIDADFTIVED